MADKKYVSRRRGGPGRILWELFRLWGLYARMDLGWLMQDLTSVVIVVLSEALQNLSSMAGVLLLSIRFGGVGGLKADEVLFMLGFYQLADGLGWMLFGNYNIIHLSRRIGRGQVDHMLMQPRPLWMQLVTEGFMPFSGCHGFLIGLLLTVIATVVEMVKKPSWAKLLLPALFLMLHVCYGAGTLAGLIAMPFWIRRVRRREKK